MHLDILRPNARALYKVLSSVKEMEGMTLVGGTALALQIAHRYSLDFDFATFDKMLPIHKIDVMISHLKEQGQHIQLITNAASISQFKINTGENLLHFVRDYVINDVKLTFFTMGKTDVQRNYYIQADKNKVVGRNFDLLGLDGLKAAKTIVLADRIRSRDLFDLMILMRDHQYTMQQAIEVINTIGHNDDPEYYKAVMTGAIPLDREDEGLAVVDVNIKLDDMYAFFRKGIDDYEVNLAENFFSTKD